MQNNRKLFLTIFIIFSITFGATFQTYALNCDTMSGRVKCLTEAEYIGKLEAYINEFPDAEISIIKAKETALTQKENEIKIDEAICALNTLSSEKYIRYYEDGSRSELTVYSNMYVEYTHIEHGTSILNGNVISFTGTKICVENLLGFYTLDAWYYIDHWINPTEGTGYITRTYGAGTVGGGLVNTVAGNPYYEQSSGVWVSVRYGIYDAGYDGYAQLQLYGHIEFDGESEIISTYWSPAY